MHTVNRQGARKLLYFDLNLPSTAHEEQTQLNRNTGSPRWHRAIFLCQCRLGRRITRRDPYLGPSLGSGYHSRPCTLEKQGDYEGVVASVPDIGWGDS